MTEHSNVQNHVIVVANSEGKVWVIGTDTQRGFTEAGAKRALTKVEEALPKHWTAFESELTPVNVVLAMKRR